MTLARFTAALRALLGIDRDELVAAGVIGAGDGQAWAAFRADPPRWLLGADEERRQRLWGLVEGRGGCGS